MFQKSLQILVASALLALAATVGYSFLRLHGPEDTLREARERFAAGAYGEVIASLGLAERSASFAARPELLQQLWRLRYESHARLDNPRGALADLTHLLDAGQEDQEALLLEDSLIKQHKPPHNVRLKDDKSFLMVRIDRDERFPRLKLVRAHKRDHRKPGGRSRFFGPFASSRSVRRTLSDLHRVVPLRDCPDSVLDHRTRPCLKHQIGLCSAPCVGLVDEAGYDELVERAVRILSGDTEELEGDLERRMREASGPRGWTYDFTKLYAIARKPG